MQYSAMSIHYLWAAYIVMGAGQVAYAVWLAVRWKKVAEASEATGARKPE